MNRQKILTVIVISLSLFYIIFYILFLNVKPNKPILYDNMIPVFYEDNKIIYADKDKSNWYNYKEKKWANAVVLKTNSKNYVIGDEINLDDIDMMYVWIPRFQYYYVHKPLENKTQEIKIKFIKGKSRLTYNDYKIHSAFTFGNTELKGFWVGKFELGNDECNNDSCADDNKNIRIKPNVLSMKQKNIKELFDISRNIENTYNINADTHMIKNSEWGAIAYITNSAYGRCNDGKCEEISKNDSKFYTGRSQGLDSAEKFSSPEGTYKYNEKKGLKASTTKNIYGIFDLSGGHDEYVMGNYKNIIGKSGFSKMPNKKYYDLYNEEELDNLSVDHALNDTKGWNNDLHNYVKDELPWLIRGGFYDCPKFAGIFGFGNKTGEALEFGTTRVIITEKEK